MSLVKSWYTLQEAESKFGGKQEVILAWVEDGLVRCERKEGEPLRVDGNDLELQTGEIAGP